MSTILKALERLERERKQASAEHAELRARVVGPVPGEPERRLRWGRWLASGLGLVALMSAALWIWPRLGADDPKSAAPAPAAEASGTREVPSRGVPVPAPPARVDTSSAPAPTSVQSATAPASAPLADPAAVVPRAGTAVDPAPPAPPPAPAPRVETKVDPAPPAPAPRAETKVDPAPAPPPLPARAQEPTRPAPAATALPERAPSRAAIEPAPAPARRVPVRRAPEVRVERTVWHPDALRREAVVRLPGSGAPATVREGEVVGSLLVLRIEPSGVVFLDNGREHRVGVGGS